ncbi:MAG: hypothetical protein JW795_09775 [Chitinivibrionales bacterium]|nr:hypothetical protein [Chitinivibrionales bacterium]
MILQRSTRSGTGYQIIKKASPVLKNKNLMEVMVPPAMKEQPTTELFLGEFIAVMVRFLHYYHLPPLPRL